MARKRNQYTQIRIKVTPRASRNQIVARENDVFKIKLNTAPVDGKANHSLINFLSRELGVPKKDVNIVSGERSRQKLVRIHGLSEDEVMRALSGTD